MSAMAQQRKQYDDEFRASAVLMLDAAGYPKREGALSHVSGHLGIARSTLRSWHNGTHNPPPANVRHKKSFDLVVAIQDELAAIFPALAGARPDATYRELVVAVGILTDKLQILSGQPTWRGELVNLIRDGTLTPDVIENELGNELARELFDAASVNRA